MSAVRDSSQASTFIYTNFYNLYRKSKIQAEANKEVVKGLVLKSHSVTEHPAFNPTVSEVRVVSPQQMEQLSHWSHSKMSTHLRSLNESRKRLKFLMAEVDDILKKA
jgi:hypothetical protein